MRTLRERAARALAIGVLCLAAAAAASCGPRWADVRTPELREGTRGVFLKYRVHRFALDNGLSVILVPDDSTNLVEVGVQYAVGAAEDPTGKEGLAHLVEHMTFELGTERPHISDRLAAVALTYNAYTSWDQTHYSAAALSDRVGELLDLEADRMASSCDQLDSEVIARERDVVRNELRQKTDVASAVEALLRDSTYGSQHVYARPIGGSEGGLDAITAEDVCAFLRDYYAPSRAVLVVTGNFDAKAARARIRERFARVPAREPRPRATVAPVVPDGATSRHRMPVRRATAFILAPSPPDVRRDGAVDQLLGALLERALFDELRTSEFLSSVSVGQIGGERAPLRVAALTVTDPAHLDDAVETFFRVRDRLGAELSRETVSPQRARAVLELLARLEQPSSRVQLLARYWQYRGPDVSLGATIDALFGNAVSQLEEPAARFFSRGAVHVAYVLPDDDRPAVEDRVALEEVAASYDIGDWRLPVDLGELERTLEVPQPRGGVAIRSFELDNGLRVLLAPSLPYPLVDIRVVFPVGSMHDPSEQPGLADAAAILLQHDLSRPFAPDDYDDVTSVMAMGGDLTARVAETTTTFRMRGLSTYADGLLWQLSWLLEAGVYDARKLERMRELARRNRDARTVVSDRIDEVILTALFGEDHPYAIAERDRGVLERVSVGELRRFRDEHYRMRGAALVIAGHFDADDVERRVRRLFGALPDEAAVVSSRAVPAATPHTRARHLGVEVPGSSQVRISFAFATASTGKDPSHAARHVLAEMLRLRVRSLRDRFGSTYGISVRQAERAAGGELVIGGAIDAARGGQALEAMREILAQLRAGEGLEEDFIRARRDEVRRLLAHWADSASVAGVLERVASGELPADGYDTLAREVAAVRLTDIRALVDAELGAEREVVVVSGDAQAVAATYRAAGIEAIELIE